MAGNATRPGYVTRKSCKYIEVDSKSALFFEKVTCKYAVIQFWHALVQLFPYKLLKNTNMIIKEWSCSNVQPLCHSLHNTEITCHCDPVTFGRSGQPHPDLGLHVFSVPPGKFYCSMLNRSRSFPPTSFIYYNSQIILLHDNIELMYLIERCETEQESVIVKQNCEGNGDISFQYNEFSRT